MIFSKKFHFSRVISGGSWAATKMNLKLDNNKYVQVTNKLSKRTPTRWGQYTPSSIKNRHILPFIKVTQPIVSQDKEISVLPVSVGLRGLVH